MISWLATHTLTHTHTKRLLAFICVIPTRPLSCGRIQARLILLDFKAVCSTNFGPLPHVQTCQHLLLILPSPLRTLPLSFTSSPAFQPCSWPCSGINKRTVLCITLFSKTALHVLCLLIFFYYFPLSDLPFCRMTVPQLTLHASRRQSSNIETRNKQNFE